MKRKEPGIKKNLICKTARFIGKLKSHKLDMQCVALLNNAKKMSSVRCNSAACVMGWLPAIFPKHAKWVYSGAYIDSVYFRVKESDTWSPVLSSEVGRFFGVPFLASYILFGSGFYGYKSPKEVSKGLREYATSDGKKLPKYNVT